MAERGHEVSLLLHRADADRREYLYKRSVNLRVNLDRRRVGLGRGVDLLCRQVGRTLGSVAGSPGYQTWSAVIPENALRAVVRRARPDVVVACSVTRVGWKAMQQDLKRAGVPAVLYIRERSSIPQLAVALPDLLLANARAHADAAAALGHACVVIPSIIDFEAARTESSQKTVLLVNPIPAYGVERALQLARLRPDVPFVLQESWPLPSADMTDLEARARELGNVEIRRFTSDIRQVYADAAVLLVPYAEDNRPRVVAEAQVSGIPVLAVARPSLEEAVGPGGLLVPDDAPAHQWAGALGRLWDEPDTYAVLSQAAYRHSQRAELQPAKIVSEFEAALARLVTDHHGLAPEGTYDRD
jgi:glycosyltransferase involved in cell wall biosynthesis